MIKICNSCKGEGKISESVSAYEDEYVECKSCDGSGRILEHTFILQVPFNDFIKFNEKQKEIFKILSI